ncbi:ABC transporter ATP-binding protein [Rathayibacter soli]|uniref:ABC transporter ATP-binding protein n=1 Tax=Rathayibacter soli TaxID=3144168 RepID=UPI0027E44190|nr:ABC transporter ATP-binding protein [Glaciibacter superstes]
MNDTILTVDHLDVAYGHGRKAFTAAHDISFSIKRGTTLGLVGESGSGKSTVGRAILGLATPRSGTITFEGNDITHASRKRRRQLASEVQVVFQDPRNSLNEAKRVGDILIEPLTATGAMSRADALNRARHLLDTVGLHATDAAKSPGDFSGGQRQRIAIARALMCHPKLVVCDEPVSALDLSVQAQIINLFRRLQAETEVAYLFIAHDLSVVRLLSERVMVMNAGRVVEEGPTEEVYTCPRDTYTKRLLAAEPYPDPDVQRRRRQEWEALQAL